MSSQLPSSIRTLATQQGIRIVTEEDMKGASRFEQLLFQQMANQQIEKVNEIKRIQKTVEKFFLKEGQSAEEEKKIKEKLKNFFDLPLIPMDLVFESKITNYFKKIFSQTIFDEKNWLIQTWSLDVYQKLDLLLPLLNQNGSKESMLEVQKDFSAATLTLKIISQERNIRAQLFGNNINHQDTVSALIYNGQKFQYNLTRLFGIMDPLSKTQHLETAGLKAFRERFSRGSNQVKKTKIETTFESLFDALILGMNVWNNLYCSRYFNHKLTIPLPTQSNSLKDNLENLEALITLTKTSWQTVNERRLAAAIPSDLFSFPLPPAVEKGEKEILLYRKEIIGAINNIYNFYCKIIQMNLKNAKTPLTLSDLQKELPFSDNEEKCNTTLTDILLSSAASLNVALNDLGDILRLYEKRICRSKIAGFSSFEQLLDRVIDNFVVTFAGPQTRIKTLHLEHFKEKGLDQIIDPFFKDIQFIGKEFTKKIHEQLPSFEVHEKTTIELLLTGKRISNPFLFANLFYPYKKAAIFVGEKVPSAIRKGREMVVCKFKENLFSLKLNDLKEDKEELINTLRSIALLELNNYLNIFITLKDIQAILLSPDNESKEIEKGLHLIPQEFVEFLNMKELEMLIDRYIEENGHLTETSSSEEKETCNEGNETKDEAIEKTENLPSLSYSKSSESLEILQTLQEFRKFTVLPGEKMRSIKEKLKKLGVYMVRSASGSHRTLAHPFTKETFSLPDHEQLSVGVSHKLEKWVNESILNVCSKEIE